MSGLEHHHGGLVVERVPDGLRLAGEFDIAELSLFTAATADLTDIGSVTIDVSELTYCDSTGINALIRLRNRLANLGGTLILDRPTRQLRVLLDLMGLEQIFVIRSEVSRE